METLQYFKSYKEYFWQWEEGGEVVAMPGSSTICYREQLITILTAISHDGLPPLGSLLLVLGAMNPQPEHIYYFCDKLLPGDDYKVLNERVRHMLEMVASLPKSYKEGIRKVETLRALFKGCHRSINAKDAAAIINEFRKIRYNGELYTAKAELTRGIVIDDFRVLSLLADKFLTVEDIKRKISGLPPTIDQKVELETEETSESSGPKDFIEELTDQPQTFPIGSLVRRIWSGLNIPFHNQLPSEQPMGGVSDITNKGDFHRLLTSEFAHDDVTLMSRLANNEALYINREIPPQSNKKERVILIDVSIRNWGTPKTIAYALLIAIARHPKTDIPCSAYVVGDSYKQVSFETVDEIITAMQELAGCHHPGKGLRKFLEDFQRKRDMELILISNPDTIKIPGLAFAIQDYLPLFRFWLIANQEGDVDVYKNQQNSRKHHQHFKLPLVELWKPNPKSSGRTKPATYRGGPVASKYPILFPGCNVDAHRLLVASDNQVFAIGNDRHLYWVDMPDDSSRRAKKGWHRVYESLKYAFAKKAIGYNSKGNVVILTHSPEHKLAVLLDPQSGRQEEFELAPEYWSSYPDYFWYNDQFHLITRKKLYIIPPDPDKEQFISESTNHPDPIVVQAYQDSLNRVADVRRKYPYFEGFLKNIERVGIYNGQLVINKHALLRNAAGDIVWKTLDRLGQPDIMATRYGTAFRFNDSHTVQTTRSGIIMLTTGDDGDTIYIPTVLNMPIAMATQLDFTGNYYYLNDEVSQAIVTTESFMKKNLAYFIQGCLKNGIKN